MPRAQALCFRLLAFALLALSLAYCRAGEAPPARVILPDAIALSADDTLEFTLQVPGLSRDGTLQAPEVFVYALKPGAAVPAPDAATSSRAVAWPSPRPGEWLVQVRGLKAPDEEHPGTADLLVRWRVPGQAQGNSETRLPAAVTFKADAADVVLLMDGSLSLGRNDPQRLRVDAARDFLDAARRTGSIGRVAIVQFDNKSRTVIPLTPLTENFEKALSQLDERGQTDIDGGIRHALNVLRSGSENAAGGSIILFTDGQQEPGKYGDAHNAAAKAGVAVHTLALGREADRALLKRIAAETGGTYSDAARDKDLRLAYAAIASKISRTRPILSQPLKPQQDIAIPVDGSVRALALSVRGDRSGTLKVENSAKQSWQSPLQARPEYFVELPESGAWQANWQEGAQKEKIEDAVTFEASARTALYPLLFRTDPHPRAAMEIDTDEPVLAVSLFEGALALREATLHAHLEFDPETKIASRSAQLFDDGQHADGAAGDGIYGAWLPLLTEQGGAYPENTAGVVRVIATGKRDGVDFRRETQSHFIMRRHDGPALVTSGPVELGTRFAGERVSAEFSVRVRGAGGAFSIKQSAPLQESVRALPNPAVMNDIPALLKARERRALGFSIDLPELLEPGEYGGLIDLELAGAERVRLPWHVTVIRPGLIAPETLDLGSLQPGDKAQVQVHLKASGGRLSVYSAELTPEKAEKDFFLARHKDVQPLFAPRWPLQLNAVQPLLKLTSAGADVDLDFDVAPDAPGGSVERTLILRGFGSRELARIVLRALIKAHHLTLESPRDLGRVEPGDSLEQELRWKWAQPGLRAPVNATVRVIPDGQIEAAVTAAQLQNDSAISRFTLPLAKDVKSGIAGGWISIESGPVLALQRWSAQIVEPRLTADPLSLDFGNLIQGQRKKLTVQLAAEGARPIATTATVSAPFAKVRLPQITIPLDALKVPQPIELKPGEKGTLTLELIVPDDAQDGLYATTLQLNSRLGVITIPLKLTVVNEIDPAPFHVSPSTLVLRFDRRSKLPLESVLIKSHRDDRIPLALTLRPIKSVDGVESKEPPAIFLAPEASDSVMQMQMSLPGRETIEAFVQAKPDAQAGQRCQLRITGAGDEHVVEILIERPAQEAIAPVKETPRVLGWIVLLIALIAAAMAYLVNRLVRRAWVRYAFYSVLFHMAFLPWAMPRSQLMDALPDSVQVSLLEGEELFGGGLSEQQMRRLEALKTGGGGTDEAVTLAQGEGLAGIKAVEKVPDLAAKDVARAGTPGASMLESTQAPEGPRVETPAAASARAAASVLPDDPLKTDALAPEPLAAQPAGPKVENPVARAVATTPLKQALPAAMPAPERRGPTALYDSALPSGVPDEAPREKQPAAPASAAPRTVIDAGDAPLEIAALPPETAPAAVPQVPATKATPAAPAAASGAPAAMQRLSTPALASLPGGNDVAVSRAIGAGPRALATTDDLKLNDSPGKEPGPAGVVGVPVSARPAPGAGLDAIDDPLDAGTLIGGVSPSGIGDNKPTGGRAGGAPADSLTHKGDGIARGGSALGGIGAGTGVGDQLAFAAGGDGKAVGGGRGASVLPGRGSGSTLPGFGAGGGGTTGQSPLAGGGTGSVVRQGGIGAGGEGDAPLSAGPVPGGGGGNGEIAGKLPGAGVPGGNAAGVPNGTGIGIARGGSALGVGLAPGGGGSELAFAGPMKRSGALSGSTLAMADLTRGGTTSPGASQIGIDGTGRRPGGNALTGDGDAPLAIDPLTGGNAGGKGTAAIGAPGKEPGKAGTGTGTQPGNGGAGGDGIRTVAANGGFGKGIGGGVGGGIGGGLGRDGIAGSLSGVPGGGGTAIPPSGRLTNRKPGTLPGSGLSSQQLEGDAGGKKGTLVSGGTLPNWRVTGEHQTGGMVRINLGLTRHSGDWDSSLTALHHLRGAFIERSGLPELEVNVLTFDLADMKALSRCRMALITSNKPIVFKPEEITAMRAFIEAGGTLWVNDSSASDYNGFDEKFRDDVPRIIEGGKLFSLPLSHPFFNSCYDLSKGYKGFRVPPGDKYRQDYIEAAFVPDPKEKDGQRAAIIYTRNDYADGLQIDPRMNAGMKSLTDLTNAEMQEASLRFGINLVAYSMGPNAPKLPPPPETTAEFEKLYRYSGPELPVFDNYLEPLDKWNKPIWSAEAEWCNETQLWTIDDKTEKMKIQAVRFSGGTKHKAAIARNGLIDLSKTQAVVFDLHSDLKSGCNIALLINTKDGKAYETRPVFSRPGWNRNLRFPLNMGDLKSSASKVPWKDYDTPLEPRDQVERITILIYNLTESGAVKIGPLKLQN
ncbi:MAG TPA: DUF4159 domain-containing protein [Planctomycetota bacterium]|nr:DUF4159 domain-containing protein [Planctomycetota bacterium]